ncbi:hypothetical protein LINPERHAP2_LOCUS13096 [Linum perenne]
MKVVWNIISKLGEMWVKALTSKYLVQSNRGFTFKKNMSFSSLWIGVLKVGS